jgi:glutamine---fructose-6-phosphate transaminase (isomerizing)
LSEPIGSAVPGAVASGAYSLAEILSQPRCWAVCLRDLEADKKIIEIGKQFGNCSEWFFTGCGSSYYIALTAAASWAAITGTRARAIPASELLLFPELVRAGTGEFVAVLISRSGHTSEVLRVAEYLRDEKIPTVGISCARKQKLEELATASLVLPAADEQSTVMTRSFTSMLIALQYLAASLCGRAELTRALAALPEPAERWLRELPAAVRQFVAERRYFDYVCLGQGPYYGLACESSLKLSEMSCSYAQNFHTLEFRHGPKSIVSGETLISFLLSQSGYEAERDVLEEIKSLGGSTLAIASNLDGRARAAADMVVELDCDLPEEALLAPFVFAGQLVGFYTALQKGLDPDRPRYLSRVVTLKED